MSGSKRPIYPDRLNFRVPAVVRETVEREAQLARCGPAEFARLVFMAGLEARGVQLPPAELVEV